MEIEHILIESIKEKKCSLLLGAGASCGAIHPRGDKIPFGQELSNLLARKFLGENYVGRTLEQNSGVAIGAAGLFPVQDFLHDLFIDFQPAPYHIKMTNIVWRSIFTLNYDLLVERCYASNKKSIQKLATLISDKDNVEDKLETIQHVSFFKLHGCISVVRDANLPLILTTEQYIEYKKNRQSLFNNLYEKSIDGPVVYVGTSLQDKDIRTVMHDVIKDTNNCHARSYLVVPDALLEDIRYWAKMNIVILQGTFENFLDNLSAHIDSNKIALALFKKELSHEIYRFFIINPSETSPVIDAFFERDSTLMHKGMQTTPVDAQTFYKGYGDGFGAIVKDLDVGRKITDDILLDQVIDTDEHRKQKVVVIVGHAGSGKTIALKRIAYTTAVTYENISIWIDSFSRNTYPAICEIYRRSQRRIFLFIDNLSKNCDEILEIYRKSRIDNIEITIFSCDRNNTWNDNEKYFNEIDSDQYDLRYLNGKEIDALIETLDKHNSLGYLTDKSSDERKNAFIEIHGRILLVALHEATSGKAYADIILDEYNSIDPETAKQIYLTICILNRLNIKVRAGLIARIYGIPFDSFRERFFGPLDSIVITQKDRVLQDMVYVSRHPHVAQMVFDQVLTTTESRYVEFMQILYFLNIDYSSDKDAFIHLTNHKNLLELVCDYKSIRVFYEKALEISPSDPFLSQQIGLFEMKHHDGNPELALQHLKRAAELAPYSLQIKHSLASYELNRAKNAEDRLEKISHRKKSKELSASLFSANSDAYPYATYIEVSLDELREAISLGDGVLTEKLTKEIERVIRVAIQQFPSSDILHEIEAKFFKLIGDHPKALESLKKSFEANKANAYIALRLARHYEISSETSEVLQILKVALEHNQLNYDLNFAYAICLMGKSNKVDDEIHRYLRKSFVRGDLRLSSQFWYARSSYLRNDFAEAKEFFTYIYHKQNDPTEKIKIRGQVYNDSHQLKEFHGKIESITHSFMFIRPDAGNEPFFAHIKNSPDLNIAIARPFDRVVFNIAFNFKGPTAVNIRME